MKMHFWLLFVILFVSVFYLSALDLDYDFAQSDSGAGSVIRVQSDSTKFLISSKLTSSGKLEVKTPPFFSVELYPFLKFGELKPNGIVRQMLNPSDINSSAKGFNEKNFKSISTPALDPDYFGVSLDFGNFDLFSFRNKGFGCAAGNKRAFLAFLIYDNRETVEQSDFYVNWSEIDSNGISFITGANSEAKLGKFWLNSEFFLSGKLDEIGGENFGTGLDFRASSKSDFLEYRKRTNNEIERTYIKYRNDFSEVVFDDKIYPKSVFMGQENKRTSKLRTTMFIKGFKFSNEADFSHSKTGKEKLINTYTCSYSLDGVTAKIETDFSKTDFELACPNAKIKTDCKKTDIEYFWTFEFSEKFNGKLRINQDRQVTLSVHYRS